jgi:hypothetical protein
MTDVVLAAKYSILSESKNSGFGRTILLIQFSTGRPESSQVTNDFLHSKSFQSGLKLTFYIPSHSSTAKTNFLFSKPFQWGQKQLLPSQSIPGHFSKSKNNFLHSQLFQSGQNRLSTFHAIPFRTK